MKLLVAAFLLLTPAAALAQADIASAGANGVGVNGQYSTAPGSLGHAQLGNGAPTEAQNSPLTSSAAAPLAAPLSDTDHAPMMSAAPNPYEGQGLYGPQPGMPALESATLH